MSKQKSLRFMVRIGVFICLVCLNGYAVAQSNPRDSAGYNRFIFKIAPPGLFDNISYQSVQAGLEFHFNPRYSVDVTYGVIFGRGSGDDGPGTGYRARLELRRYMHANRPQKLHKYFAVDIFNYNMDYSFKRSHYDDPQLGSPTYFVHKEVYGGDVKFGFEIFIRKRMVIDIYAGPGFRFKNTNYFNGIAPSNGWADQFLVINNRDTPGNMITPNISAGFKLGYKF